MKLPHYIAAARSRIGSYEPLVIVIFCIASGAAFVFARLTGEMLEGETLGFDETILKSVRQPADLSLPIGPIWLTKAFTDITALGGVTVLSLITIMTVTYLLLIRRNSSALFVSVSIVGGWLASYGLKLGVARPRPDIVPHLVEVHDLSFPSGHAMVSAVTYLTLGALLSRTQISVAGRYYFVCAAIMLTLLVGISRVYLGVHYPTDVLGGWCAGAAWACCCWLVARRFLPPATK